MSSAAEAVTAVGDRTCEDCGAEFRAKMARYCPACRALRRGREMGAA